MPRMPVARVLLAGLIALGTGPAPERAEDRNRTAVPLYIPSVSSPIETAGSGLGPEVRVRLRVDASGRTLAVEVLRIEPSSAHDDLFRADVQKALLRSRFAPALHDGAAVEAQVPLTVRYLPLTGAAATGNDSLRPGPLREDQLEREALEILGLDPKTRQGLLDLITQDALRHFRGPTTRVDAGRFTVYAGADSAAFVRAIAANLQALFTFLEKGFNPPVSPQPDDGRFVVLVFDTMREYQSLSTSFDGGFDWSQGFYMPHGMLGFHRQVPTDEDLLGTLLHEATHAYVDRHVVRPGVPLPRWLGEGYAEYIGSSEVRDGKLALGKLRKRENYRAWFGRIRTRSTVLYALDDVKKALRKDESLTLGSIVGMDAEGFYAEGREMNYQLSWLIVHFLHHGRPEWTPGRFAQFLLYIAEGFPAEDALRHSYGAPEALEAEFRKYVGRL